MSDICKYSSVRVILISDQEDPKWISSDRNSAELTSQNFPRSYEKISRTFSGIPFSNICKKNVRVETREIRYKVTMIWESSLQSVDASVQKDVVELNLEFLFQHFLSVRLELFLRACVSFFERSTKVSEIRWRFPSLFLLMNALPNPQTFSKLQISINE